MRLPDNGTLRRFAGSISVDPSDRDRAGTRRMFGDLLSYTPNRPDGTGSLGDGELYTRGTVGIYVNAGRSGSTLTQQEVGRLREFLARFTPVNLRALVILVTADYAEFVYDGNATLQDRYHDVYPFSDALGPLTDATAAIMQGMVVIRSNLADNVSANPANLNTLRRRTRFDPLQ
jgi:hypothetical protein